MLKQESKAIQSATRQPVEQPTAPSLQNMRVDQCIALAIQGNLDYAVIAHRIEQARAALASAKAEYLPIFSIRAQYFHADSPAMYFATKLDQHEFQMQGNLNQTDDFGSSQLSFNFYERLNLAGREALNRKVAQINLETAQLEQAKLRNILVDAIILAYYDMLASQKYIAIAEKSVTTVDAQLQETKVKYAGGGVLKSDVLALEVRLASAQEDVIRARNRYILAKNSLAYLMGLDPEVEISLEEQDWQPRELPPNYEQGIAIALATRPEIAQVRKQLLAAKYGIAIAQSHYWPDIEAFGSYYWEDRDFRYTSNRDNWKIGGAIVWNIFDGFRTYTRVWQAKEMFAEMEKSDQKTVLAIKHEVSTAYRNLEEAQARSKVLDLAVQQAEENLALVKKQYEGGAATITKYLDTELSYTQAQFQWTQAQYDIKKAKAALGKALGYCGLCVAEEKQY